jgi:hypothetical protein
VPQHRGHKLADDTDNDDRFANKLKPCFWHRSDIL